MALLLTFILFGVSLVYDLLGFEGRPIEIAGGAILLLTALLEFQRKPLLFGWKAEDPERHSEKAAWLSLATVPSIAAVSFLIADTKGSPTQGTYFLLAAVAAAYYTLLGSNLKWQSSTARPHFRWLSKIPSGIVLIVALDIMLISIWP
jgi:small neutral amino acid transporter SnatA (MarC family)